MKIQVVKHDGINAVKYAGELLEFGDTKLVVPALSLGDIKRFKELIGVVRTMNGDDKIGILGEALPIVHAAIIRNYPNMTLEQVGELVDIESFGRVMRCVWGVSGLLAASGEEGASGEPKVAATA